MRSSRHRSPIRVAGVPALVLAACMFCPPARAQSPHARGACLQLAPAQPELELDHGRPWRTDAPLRAGMERIRATVVRARQAQAGAAMSVAQSQALAAAIERDVGLIVRHARPGPGADVNVHILLGRLLAADGVSQMLEVLDLYPRYFAHPGWRPVDRDH